MQVIGGKLERNETTETAMGGTELLATRLVEMVSPELLKDFQIVFSRERELDESKIRIYYAHDLPNDHEAIKALGDERWKRYHKLVFVSHWQMQKFIDAFNIPYSHCIVLQNSIVPIDEHEKPKDVLRLGYWSTPHRGLQLLVPVFKALVKKYENIELEVFSSFKLYGWEERDSAFAEVLQECTDHPKIHYHGTTTNSEIRSALERIHILAYPSIWSETSCLVLMEAMSAGCFCVHSSLAALPETAANWTQMYQFDEDPNRHASLFYANMEVAIENFWNPEIQKRLIIQKSYADAFYNAEIRAKQWSSLLQHGFQGVDRKIKNPNDYFRIVT